ncbi:nucleobase:cation symporter-2 family protein [Salidesulfovibrio onnuriiensis]|uniref:nucleobase:cation symporter-2 family protein n=1 Tax=Salidesulfovibrio onnuriiensis TaxID=2583823 RepID=UPI0011CC2CC8|nr:nucleobase:cation symporter-2 family protein [Salidesulfovibrio onnuriiensis]
MSQESSCNYKEFELIYGLNDNPPMKDALFAALQHFLAMFIGIMTPPIIISGALGMSPQMSAYMISMALFVSGVATFIQARKFGPLGSGMLSIQGTSFAFLSTIISIGMGVIGKGGSPEEAVATICGVALVGSIIQMTCSRFLPMLRKVFPPLVSGIVVTMIGLSLIKVGIIDFGGGFAAMGDGSFGSIKNLCLGGLVLAIIVVLNRSKRPFVRISSVAIGLLVGYAISAAMGDVNFSQLEKVQMVSIPMPFKYGIGFDWSGFILMAFLYIITIVESIGDLTATAMLSNKPVKGPEYIKTISGGVLADGFNSALAAVFNTFPNTTFSQNNGVIQLTGVASRYVGFYIAGLLVLVGIFPIVGGIFSLIPKPVLGGATLILFGSVAAAGVKIMASQAITRRAMLIMALSFGTGLGVVFAPDIVKQLPAFAQTIFGSAITTGGFTAIIANLVLPMDVDDVEHHEMEAVCEDA